MTKSMRRSRRSDSGRIPGRGARNSLACHAEGLYPVQNYRVQPVAKVRSRTGASCDTFKRYEVRVKEDGILLSGHSENDDPPC